MNTQELYQKTDAILARYGTEERSMIAVLQAVQEEYAYLPREVFPYLSERMGLSEAHIYGVATFYENFSLEPKGKYVIKVCDGTACHVPCRFSTACAKNWAFRPRRSLQMT